MIKDTLKDTLKDIKGQGLKDKNYHLVLSKAHKLSSALYAVTNFMSDRDPLKWRLRCKGLDLLSAVHNNNFAGVLSLIDEAVSLIDIALLTANVSEMNFSLLKQEYFSLRHWLQNQIAPLSFGPAFGPELKASQTQALPVAARQSRILVFIKEHGGIATVGEIAKALPNLSRKTAQRELSFLVKQGMLAKHGERRWRQYRLTG